MSNPILFDVESRSRADLKRVGGRLYWQHPSTEVLVVAWYDPDTTVVGVWHQGDPPPRAWRGRTLAAHNVMGFDRFAIERLGWRDPSPRGWVDTSEYARMNGLPGALDALGTRILGIPKDHAGSRFTVGLSTVRRPSRGAERISPEDWRELTREEKRACGALPEVTPEALARVTEYCVSDVEILAGTWEDHLAPAASIDAPAREVDHVINDRGVHFDQDLASALLECDSRNANRVVRVVARELGWDASVTRETAVSPTKFAAATGAPNAQKDTVAELDHPLARARQALASIARGKLEAGLARVSHDSRLRDSHRYYGAHTGRWSGFGMQLQNMPRPSKRLEDRTQDDIVRLSDRVLGGWRGIAQDEVDLLLRATITAPPGHTLAVCDLSGVEARGLAWAAGDHDALDVFASGRNPYREMGATIFGVGYDAVQKGTSWYTVGKQAELACGYGMGKVKFGDTARGAGVDLAEVGVDAGDVVKAWRRKHAPVVRFWRAVERAFAQALEGDCATVGCFTFEPASDGSAIAAWLPSGRPIVYNAPAMSLRDGRPSLSFHGTKSGREYTYGGKLVENLIQALCRDLFAGALVQAELDGLKPVMHVHDEIVCEVPEQAGAEALDHLQRIMTALPDWAKGFPIGAAGHHGKRYMK